MKSILLIALTSFIILSACNKKSESGDITGKWELTEIRGMIIFDTIPDNLKETLTLNDDTYESKIGNVITAGTYATAPDSGVADAVCLQIEPGKYSRRIDFSKRNSDQKVFYQLDGSTLKMISGCFAYDGGAEKIYRKISDANK